MFGKVRPLSSFDKGPKFGLASSAIVSSGMSEGLTLAATELLFAVDSATGGAILPVTDILTALGSAGLDTNEEAMPGQLSQMVDAGLLTFALDGDMATIQFTAWEKTP